MDSKIKQYNYLWQGQGLCHCPLSKNIQFDFLKKQLCYMSELPLIVDLHDWLQKQTMN